MNLDNIFRFLGGKLVKTKLDYYKWEFEQYKHLNHPTWKNLKLEENWNFIHLVIKKINNINPDLKTFEIGVTEELIKEYMFKGDINECFLGINEISIWCNDIYYPQYNMKNYPK